MSENGVEDVNVTLNYFRTLVFYFKRHLNKDNFFFNFLEEFPLRILFKCKLQIKMTESID